MISRTSLPLVVLMLMATLGGCGSDSSSGPRLRSLGRGGTGASIWSEQPGAPYLMPVRALCTTGSPVRITSVRPWRGTHIRIVAWGVRVRTPRSPWTSLDNNGGLKGLPTDYPGFGHHPVSVRCGTNSNRAVEDFDISAAFSGTRGQLHGLRIGYGDGEVAHSQFDLALCSTRTCADYKPPH